MILSNVVSAFLILAIIALQGKTVLRYSIEKYFAL